jgi:F-type H+/Na+-transporting ATPase subunit alpha
MSEFVDDLVDQKITAIKKGKNIYEVGRVTRVNNQILEAEGIEDVGYYEKVRIGDKGEGYISAIKRQSVVVEVTKASERIQVGDEIIVTGKEYKGYYTTNSVGHIIDLFGTDKLTGDRFDGLEEISLANTPIPIMDRAPVNRPMLTGITGIDMIYPVGRGQRQLIVGDKKTGKTQLALDTIINQKNEDMLCIYVAVGKTKKEVKEIYTELLGRGAMDYTMIIAAFNDEFPAVLKCTPSFALAVAEHHMLTEKRDVLVVIDDLKRHADICREISLLSGKVPGREAYPSDIFFTHASILEKGCQHKNGGSITVLPIAETRGGDITDYIASNIISITDGQIVLSAKSFKQGYLPAIDYGLSVSRLGGAVQTHEVKRVGAVVRRELLAYLENCDIYELANIDEIGPELRRKMLNGKAIRTKLNQYKYSPRAVDEMIHLFDGLIELS